ncbi:hypothetical protein Tco_0449947 [Tanacetum coccineum]
MSSITAQQTKLDLELVSKEKYPELILENAMEGIPRGLTPKNPHFKVVLDAISSQLQAILHFASLFCGFPEGREFDPLASEEDTVSFLRELGHTREINSPNDVVVDQMHQPWRTFAALINRSLSGKTSGLDLSSSSLPYLKSFGMKNLSQKANELSDQSRSLQLSQQQLKEVRKKSLRDFYKTHPSGSGTVTEKPPSDEKITPTVTSEGTCDKLGVLDVTEDDSTKSESESWEQEDESNDDNQEEEEVDQENESEKMRLAIDE